MPTRGRLCGEIGHQVEVSTRRKFCGWTIVKSECLSVGNCAAGTEREAKASVCIDLRQSQTVCAAETAYNARMPGLRGLAERGSKRLCSGQGVTPKFSSVGTCAAGTECEAKAFGLCKPTAGQNVCAADRA